MKKKLKGPELKLPEVRMPLFLVDLYYDLRDRRLLPLVALVLVAIVAVPFLLSGGSEEEAPPPRPLSAAPAAGASELAVVQSSPGLRDYRRRLRGRAATDPFQQRYTGSPAGKGGKGEEKGSFTTPTTESSGGGGGGGGGASPAATVSPTSAGGASTPPPAVPEANPQPAGGGGQQPAPGKLTLYSFAVDVRIVRIATGPEGEKEQSPPTTRERAVPPAPLPGEKTQVVTYMGISPKTRQPLLLISDGVTATFGEGTCLSGASTCQLLEVETGMPVTFVYGPDNVRYKITVLEVEPVVSGHS